MLRLLAFFLPLLGSSCAQSGGVNAGLVGVLAVCGGTVVIIFIIWLAICYGLYRTERDFCEFKKRLRRYRRYRERVVQQLQQRQWRRRMRRRTQPWSQNNRDISPPIEQALPAQGSNTTAVSHPMTPPPVFTPTEQPRRDTHNTQLPPSSVRSSETPTPVQPNSEIPSRGRESGATHVNNTSQEESSRVRNNGVMNGKNGKSVHFSQRLTNPQTKKITDTQRLELLQQQGQQSQESQSHPHESHNTRLRAVLGHYSPKSLREEEEMDVRLDEDSSPPRYSWVFSDKRKVLGRSGDGKNTAEFGQLQTWPQLTL